MIKQRSFTQCWLNDLKKLYIPWIKTMFFVVMVILIFIIGSYFQNSIGGAISQGITFLNSVPWYCYLIIMIIVTPLLSSASFCATRDIKDRFYCFMVSLVSLLFGAFGAFSIGIGMILINAFLCFSGVVSLAIGYGLSRNM